MKISEYDIKRQIAEIDSMDLKTVSIDVLKTKLMALSKGLVSSILPISPQILLIRGRPYKNPEKPNRISDISYCPADKVSKHGRANRAGSTVFYGCSYLGAVLMELNLQPGDYVAIGRWTVRAPLRVNFIGYFANTHEQGNTNRRLPLSMDQLERLNPNLTTKKNLRLAQYFHDKFVQDVLHGEEHLYLPTLSIAEFWLKHDQIDGLLYPSIAAQFNTPNIAIKPHFVDEHMRLLRADFAYVKKRDDSTFELDWIDSATAFGPSGEILWKGHKDRWTLPLGCPLPRLTHDQYGFEYMEDSNGNFILPDEL